MEIEREPTEFNQLRIVVHLFPFVCYFCVWRQAYDIHTVQPVSTATVQYQDA